MRNLSVWPIAALGIAFLTTALVAAEPTRTAKRDAKKPMPVETGSGTVIRAASDQPLTGFEKVVVSPTETLYVAPNSVWTTAEIVSISEGTEVVAVQVTPEAAARLAISGLGERIAIFVDGHLSAAPHAKLHPEASVVELTGLLPGQAQRLGRVLTATQTSAKGPTLVLVPRETLLTPGSTAIVDVYVNNIGDIRAYQVAVDVTLGQAGGMEVVDLAIDATRPDYVFAGQESVNAADKTKARALGAMYAGSVAAMQQSYLATYTLKVAANAIGVFEIQVRTNSDTLLRDSNGLPIGFNAGPPATITVGRMVQPAAQK